ncbi:hypothetical protein MJO29_016986 [Puccinia striiformis f. sp. tritici]|nr:hypothetical protein MJO29_016986 [Puccinia striiformis f. sp. tritici]
MVLGRITHYAVDLALISTVLAGVKRNTGYSVKVQELPEGVPQTVATSYLKTGEKIFDSVSAFSLTTTYFHRGPIADSGKPSWPWGAKPPQ